MDFCFPCCCVADRLRQDRGWHDRVCCILARAAQVRHLCGPDQLCGSLLHWPAARPQSMSKLSWCFFFFFYRFASSFLQMSLCFRSSWTSLAWTKCTRASRRWRATSSTWRASTASLALSPATWTPALPEPPQATRCLVPWREPLTEACPSPTGTFPSWYHTCWVSGWSTSYISEGKCEGIVQ